MSNITAGVYRHYKGQHYLVLGLAHDANADRLYRDMGRVNDEWQTAIGERTLVVYVALYDAPGPRMAVRDYDDFMAWVHPEDGTRCMLNPDEREPDKPHARRFRLVVY